MFFFSVDISCSSRYRLAFPGLNTHLTAVVFGHIRSNYFAVGFLSLPLCCLVSHNLLLLFSSLFCHCRHHLESSFIQSCSWSMPQRSLQKSVLCHSFLLQLYYPNGPHWVFAQGLCLMLSLALSRVLPVRLIRSFV
jgi:hypothetical protein